MNLDNQHCRFCGHELNYTFADLGLSPLSNEYLKQADLDRGQMFYPLDVKVCEQCFLVQAAEYQRPEQIFGDYQYFSSYSESWLAHCKAYVAQIVPRLSLTSGSRVLEIACNDGYLLQYFQPYGIPVKGIEPAENVADEARKKGIEVECCFFGADSAQEIAAKDGRYSLVIGNNVLAHVPDINSFVEGLAIVLAAEGTITMEFPHLLRLIEQCQFDTIYHEHFHYLSLGTVKRIFNAHGLEIYDVEELPTHGGSLRIYAAHQEYGQVHMRSTARALLTREQEFGLENIQTYAEFSTRIQKTKVDTLRRMVAWKQEGKHIAAFGAAAKGNTFLNYCGIKNDLIDYVVDSNPHKQGLYLPGSLIPIVGQEALREYKPDYLLILPWNLTDEIVKAAGFIREWGGQFVVCIPHLNVF
jgi:SAM-dependent methyltransferase